MMHYLPGATTVAAQLRRIKKPAPEALNLALAHRHGLRCRDFLARHCYTERRSSV